MPLSESSFDLTAVLEGFASVHADLVRLDATAPLIVRREEAPWGTVGVLSGGGSGHEPLHLGFVGAGMLSVAVPGPVFTSPGAYAILAGIRAADRGAGVLCLVKNYTGDVLNFDIATELAAAEGISTRTLVISDDVAVKAASGARSARGIAGAVLVEKLLGAAADRGDDLDTVALLGERILAGLSSVGVALSACTSPITHLPSFDLEEDEMEFGVGLHGEPGTARLPRESLGQMCDRLWEAVSADQNGFGDEPLLVLINGLGAMTDLELYAAFARICVIAAEHHVVIERNLVGTYATALDMHGFSLSVLRLDAELRSLWDAPVHTPALRLGR